MSLILHQAAKDLRAQRWPLAAWLAMLTTLSVLAAFPPGWSLADATASERLYEALAAFGWAVTVTGWFIVVRIVQEDPLDRDEAFWVTRPLSPGGLLAAKLIVILPAFLALPTAAVVAVAAANGVGPSLLGWVAAEHLACNAAFLVIVLVIASVTNGQARFVFGVVMAGLIYALVHLLAFTHSAWLSRRPPLADLSGVVLAVAAVMCGGAALIAHQYFTRRTRRTATLGVIGLVLAVAIGDNFPWSFWRGNQFATPPALDARQLDPSRIRLSLAPGSLQPVDSYRGEVSVLGRIQTTGAPPNWVVRPVQGRWALHVDRATPPVEASGSIGMIGGVGSEDATPGVTVRLLSLPRATLQEQQGVPGDFEASMQMAAATSNVGNPIPLEVGASERVGNWTIRVLEVENGRAVVLETKPRLALQRRRPDVSLMVRSRTGGSAKTLAGSFTPWTTIGLPWSGLFVLQGTMTLPDGSGWPPDAELVPTELQLVGVFEKRLKVEGFVVPAVNKR